MADDESRWTLVCGSGGRREALIRALGLSPSRERDERDERAAPRDLMRSALSSIGIVWRLPPIGTHVPSESRMLRMADGGTVHLSWCPSRASARASRGVVLVCPGLNNTSRWSYIRQALVHLARRGFAAVCFDYRGYCAPLTSSRVGSADSWKDIGEVVADIRAAAPSDVPIFGLGFSVGGTLLTRYLASLGEVGEPSPIRAVVTVSSPFDLPALFTHLESTLPLRALDATIAAAAKLTFVRHASSAALANLDWRRVAASMNMSDLAEATVLPLDRCYATPDEYHRSCTPDLSRVAVDMLSIHAVDDPLVPLSTLPLARFRDGDRRAMVLTRRGGHLGWSADRLAGTSGPTWVDEVAARFFEWQLPSASMSDGATTAAPAARDADRDGPLSDAAYGPAQQPEPQAHIQRSRL